jgi:sulfotransferase family protein
VREYTDRGRAKITCISSVIERGRTASATSHCGIPYSDALVVLSTRPAKDWYRSAASTIFQLNLESSLFRDLWRSWMGDRLDDPEAMIAAYERHYAAVRASIPASRLLEWSVRDGWEPLCDRLGVPVPEEAFPWTNTTEEFRAHNGLDAAGRA